MFVCFQVKALGCGDASKINNCSVGVAGQLSGCAEGLEVPRCEALCLPAAD